MKTINTSLKRSQLRRLLLHHRGESARLARDLDLDQATVSRWLKGSIADSPRIQSAVLSRAKELLEKDAENKRAEEQILRELASPQISAA